MFLVRGLRPTVLILAAAAVTLSACAELAGPAAPPSAAAPAPAPAPAAAAAPPAIVSPRPATTARLPEAPRPDPPPLRLDPGVLVGLDPGDVELVAGRPSAVREEPPAVIWIYQVPACVLEVFFYRELKSQRVLALAYAVRGDDQSEAAKQACFAAVREEPRG
jgi:hypothetical protein